MKTCIEMGFNFTQLSFISNISYKCHDNYIPYKYSETKHKKTTKSKAFLNRKSFLIKFASSFFNRIPMTSFLNVKCI